MSGLDKGKRFSVQAAATLLQNANFKGFFTSRIYSGPIKQVCVPGLNCYSCPGAVGACPLGSLQNSLSALKFRFPYYILGLLLFFGAFLGRAVCCFICPFGWLQELLNMIPFFKKNRFRADRPLRFLKYLILAVMVVILPMAVKLTPFFCKYVCPAGTVAGLSLILANHTLQEMIGILFSWKTCLLLIVLISSTMIHRPFCKYLCPLGAIYGLFSKFSLYQMNLDKSRCVGCHKCEQVCPMQVKCTQNINSAECIRCGRCKAACPAHAIDSTFGFRLNKETENNHATDIEGT